MLKLRKPLKKIRSSCMSNQFSITALLSRSTHIHCLLRYLNRGSQEERITILKMAITEKGIIHGRHYDLQVAPISKSQPSITQPNSSHIISSAIWL